jgi:23S rRNA pseudouridine1911/1915/1917 synthase
VNAPDPTGAADVRHARVPEALAGARLDQALTQLFPEFSRSRLAQWVRDGRVRIGARAPRPRDPVAAGDEIVLEVRREAEVALAPEAIALEVLYQDADVLVINKPPGLVVHPGAGNPAGTLQNALLHFDAQLANVPRAGIVHRLDKDTSGALVVARTLEAHTRLAAQLAERDVSRRYEALVEGVLVAGGTVDAPIGRHPRDRQRMAVTETGKPAVTHYRVRERFRAHTLLEVELETGRTHQIRVHMAHLRHPLVGDADYGRGLKLPRGATPELVAQLRGFRRQALHAERLEFAHPRNAAPVAVEAPRPRDLDALLRALRDDTRAAAR